MDYYEEKQEIDNWTNKSIPQLEPETLVSIIIKGINQCEGDCDSRAFFGEGSCQCVRSELPHPLYYPIYKHFRNIHTLLRLEKAVIEANNEQKRTS